MRVAVSSELGQIRIPPLLLQPIVENAVKHGVAPRLDGGEVLVAAHLERARSGMSELVLTVTDSGKGATPLEMAHGRALGVGLQNVERRLTHQYGAAASLTVDSIPDRGTTVTIKVPVRVGSSKEPVSGGR